MDTVSADSESKEPPAPKVPPEAPPRRCRPRISRLPNGARRESSSSDKDTPPAKARSSRAQAPTLEPRKNFLLFLNIKNIAYATAQRPENKPQSP
ncbi:hypothetical protein P4O66_002748 [Electrophorus voltai]|uniref:Uncharacterized protein n=1 Tax=Electrophorus voltai TaxID=2609070 RepID=A0AAD9DMK0_9TELE|nr:hypothetical protein P4O66_002748 [Electrophorus voltai]